jgi:hypothetical protein
MNAERWLKLILRLTGAALILGFLFVFVPRSWHAAIHEWCGFGAYPAPPVIDYLARTASAIYGLSGVFCWLVSFDLVRHKPVIAFLAEASILFGILCTVVDHVLGMPWWWRLGEGPPAVGLGIVMLMLLGRVRPRF